MAPGEGVKPIVGGFGLRWLVHLVVVGTQGVGGVQRHAGGAEKATGAEAGGRAVSGNAVGQAGGGSGAESTKSGANSRRGRERNLLRSGSSGTHHGSGLEHWWAKTMGPNRYLLGGFAVRR